MSLGKAENWRGGEYRVLRYFLSRVFLNYFCICIPGAVILREFFACPAGQLISRSLSFPQALVASSEHHQSMGALWLAEMRLRCTMLCVQGVIVRAKDSRARASRHNGLRRGA